MIIQDTAGEVTIAGALEQKDFKIKTDDGKMFHILSNLYSNPLGAVVRELSTNCNDGHKIAGCADKPFDIILPGRMDMGNFIKFRDYGPGMPHDVVMTIFTTFGESTKANSNEETGCLGLGSKSPLAITDSFTVTSINEGRKTVYTVSKDAHKRPSLTMFGSNDTDEPNGLLITVPLTDHMMGQIRNEIIDQLKFFNVKPNVYKGADLQDYNWDTNDDFIKVTDEIFVTTKNNKDSNIVQGEVGYSFSDDILKRSLKVNDKVPFLKNIKLEISSDTLAMLDKFFYKFKLRIFMPMGSVSFAPSREELIYDDVTVENILKKFLLAIEYVDKSYVDIYKNVECDYQMRSIQNNGYSLLNALNYTSDQQKFLNLVGFSFASDTGTSLTMKNGKTPRHRLPKLSKLSYIEDILEMKTVNVNYDEVQIYTMIRRVKEWGHATRKTIESDSIHNYIDIEDYKNIKIVFINKETKFYKKHLSNYVLSNYDDSKNDYDNREYVFYVKLEVVTTSAIDEMIDQCGLTSDNILPFSEVLIKSQAYIDSGKAPAKLAVSKPKTLRRSKLIGMDSTISDWYMDTLTTADIDSMDGYYIETFNNSLTSSQYDNITLNVYNSSSPSLSKVKSAVTLLRHLGCDIEDKYIYAGHEKNFKKTTLVNLFEYLDSQIKKFRSRNSFEAMNYNVKEFNVFSGLTGDTMYFMDRLSMIQNNLEEISDRRHINLKKILPEISGAIEIFNNEYNNLENCFYKNDHKILKLYNDFISFNGDEKLIRLLYSVGFDQYNVEKIEEVLDVEFVFDSFNDDVDKIVREYKISSMFGSIEYTYSYYSNPPTTKYVQDLVNIIDKINKHDYIEDTFPNIRALQEKHISDEEDEDDSAINTHDYIDQVAE